MFVLYGKFNNKKASLKWDDGKVSGTRAAVDAYASLQEKTDGQVYIPEMGTFDNQRNKDPLATFVRFTELLYPVSDHEGDLPEMPQVPDGAIG